MWGEVESKGRLGVALYWRKRQPVFSQEGGGTVHLGLTCGFGQNCESLI